MGSFSNYLENKILDHVVGKSSYMMPTVYVALSTTEPLDTGSGLTEPSSGGYVRKSTTGADWEIAANGATQNANAITFTQASGNWGSLSHFALVDALSGGNMLAYGTIINGPKPVTNGDIPSFAAGALDITLD